LAYYDGDIHGFFQKVFLCSPDIAASIGKRAQERRFPIRAILLKQGDRAGATFLLVTGKAHALTYGLEGQMVLLREFMPGDFFGAIALAEPQPEEADVVAVEEVRAAVFLVLDFLNLIETYGCVGLVVSQALLRQLRAASAKMLERSTLSAAGRVHVELLRLARLGDGRTIRPAPVLAALAVRVQSTRETVSRTINMLERRGIIRRDGDALFIVAPQRLEEMIA
jgi:CRP/FNR family transcriptional regulator, cyclic AMP receptor protein